MLMELHIRNFALIDSIDLEFYSGLNILTGETGAGKSIVIDSVNFILGDKQTKEIIRSGQASAFAEAVFYLDDNHRVNEILHQLGIDTEELLIISREINQNGRSVSRINGRTVTIGNLKSLSSVLIDIHGQHEHQSLLDEAFHIEILDSFCGEELHLVKKKYSGLYHRTKEIDRELAKLKTDEKLKLRRIDLLKYQAEEIGDAKLKLGEDEELEKRREILANSEKILNIFNLCYINLYENDEKSSAFDELSISIANLDSISKYDEKIKDMSANLNDIYYKLEDVIENIRAYRNTVEFDEAELESIEYRLDVINKLKRKYGSSIDTILNYFNEIMVELGQIERADEIIEELTKEREACFAELMNFSNQITQIRSKVAGILTNNIESELKYLGMSKAVFEIEIKESEAILENGRDVVSFKISANPGESPKALVKVASGGEMSRIMLAIKSVIAKIDSIPTLIFDEIDTGISGRTAQAVAEKMSAISKQHQLLCVTHLPQIAAMADSHFKIEKVVNEEKTTTTVKKMEEDEQIEELARMLGGAVVTDITREHSKEMIKLATITKNKI